MPISSFVTPHFSSISSHQHFPNNEIGHDFVVGDIHGQFKLLMEELSYEGFDKKKDRVFSVGDLIDRGPDSLACLSLIEQPWFHAVRGNHEQMMIEWAKGEGFPRWQSAYGTWTRELEPNEIALWVEKLSELPVTLSFKHGPSTVGICHAETNGKNWNKMMSDRSRHEQMMWGRKILRSEGYIGTVEGVDITIHGHTPVPQMRRVANRYFIDTGAGMGQNLTVRNVAELLEDAKIYSVFN